VHAVTPHSDGQVGAASHQYQPIPLSSSSRATSTCPLDAASCRAVRPFFCVASTFAPVMAGMTGCQPGHHDECMQSPRHSDGRAGRQHHTTSHPPQPIPFSSSHRATSLWPFCAAACRDVDPLSFAVSTSAPFRVREPLLGQCTLSPHHDDEHAGIASHRSGSPYRSPAAARQSPRGHVMQLHTGASFHCFSFPPHSRLS
jgi:hypothetical protein